MSDFRVVSGSDFRVVSASAAEVADEIVSRLACNELPAECAAWVREQAKHGQIWGQMMIGHGPAALALHYKLMPDGKITLQLADVNGRPFWETTLRPAE